MKPFHSARLWLAVAAVSGAAIAGASAAAPGGTPIANTVSASYSDGNGTQLSTISNTVVATVAAISSVGVTPNETGCNPQTDGFAIGTNVTRTFVITNSSNISDAYTIDAATSGGTIAMLAETSGGVTTTLPNGAPTQVLAPGAPVAIAVTIATTNVQAGTDLAISLKASSTALGTANGRASASATQCAIAQAKAVLGGPGGSQSLVRKLVDGLPFETVSGGQSVGYTISFEDYGGLAATGAVLVDTFPAGITPSLASLQLDGAAVGSGATLAGQTLTVNVGSLAPNRLYVLTIAATVSPGAALGSAAINTATLFALDAATVSSTPAVVLDGVANVVYDGYAGATQPVAGAVVALVDPATGLPLGLAGTPVAPNAGALDPFTTAAAGTYAFGLGPKQIGPGSYEIVVVASGYRSRRIRVTLSPDPSGAFYAVAITALDGQPLAVPGGFALTAGPVTIPALAGLFGNIPLFRTQSIQITKQVDRSVASAGDRLVYTVSFSNIASALGAATLVDTLPAGLAYAPGTGLVDGAHVEPVAAGRTLSWSFPSLASKHTIVYATVVVPGVSAGSTLTNVATISAVPANAPSEAVSASASADTAIVGGIFTAERAITGRVFIDRRGDGWFHRGDDGIASVRIYLEDGESVVSDRNGRYAFPGVRPGMHVLKIDPTTLPATVRPYPTRAYDDRKSLRRLVHDIFDGGVIDDVNFALEAAS